MITPGFSIDITGALEAAQGISDFPRKVTLTQRRAVSTLRRRLLTEAKRDIGREYNLKAGRIADGLRARSVQDGLALVGASRGINAAAFGATWSRTRRGKTTGGARYKFRRSDAIRQHAGTFIARGIGSGTPLVFQRDTKRGKHRVSRGVNAGRMKEYLLAVYGPSVAQMLKHGARPERLAQFALGVIDKEIDRQLARVKGAAA